MPSDNRSIPVVEVFSRPGCHLCEELMEQLLPLARDRFTVELRNIDSRADWTEEFGIRIPVVRVGGVDICQYYLDREALQRALGG